MLGRVLQQAMEELNLTTPTAEAAPYFKARSASASVSHVTTRTLPR
jgi:hypothetical protein